MQQSDAMKPQQEQHLCFNFLVGSKDPAPAGGGAFCMCCGHRHKSSRWRTCTVVVGENLNVEVRASGITVLSGGIEHSPKQQTVVSSLSVRRHDILELQRKCRPGEYVYPKLVGKHKTAVCSASYQRLGKVHTQRPSSQPKSSVAVPASSQAALLPTLPSGLQLQEVTQQLNAEKQQHERTRDKLAAVQQQHMVTKQELLDVHQQYDSLSADVECLLRQLNRCEEQTAQSQQPQQAVYVDTQHQFLQQQQEPASHSRKRSSEPPVEQSQPHKRMSNCASQRTGD